MDERKTYAQCLLHALSSVFVNPQSRRLCLDVTVTSAKEFNVETPATCKSSLLSAMYYMSLFLFSLSFSFFCVGVERVEHVDRSACTVNCLSLSIKKKNIICIFMSHHTLHFNRLRKNNFVESFSRRACVGLSVSGEIGARGVSRCLWRTLPKEI